MDALSRLVAIFVLNSLWQVALLAGTAWTVDRVLRRGPARHRHLLWVGCLMGALVLALLSLRPQARNRLTTPAISLAETIIGPQTPLPAAIADRPHKPNFWLAGWRGLSFAGTHRMLSLPRPAERGALALYLMLMAVMLARFARACLCTRRIRRRARAVDPLPPHAAEALDQCRRTFQRGSRRLLPAPMILSSPRIPGPVTVGARRPAIILPAALLESGMHEDLTAALAHEMAHICRRDYLWNLIFELLFLPLSFHPLAVLILRRIGDTRELACDELAARVVTTSRYVRSLVRLAHDMSCRAGAALAPNYTLGVFDANILEERVMRLLKPRASGHLARFSLLLAVLLMASLSFAAARLSIGVAQPAGSGAGARTATANQALTQLAGTWAGKFDGKTYALLRLKWDSGHLAGTISLGQTSLDSNAKVNRVIEEARNPRSIVLAKSDGNKYYFKESAGDEGAIYEVDMRDADHARLTITGDGGPLPPFDVVRETGAVASASPVAVRQVAYADTNHVVRGAVSGGVSNGVAHGISGTISGGVAGGISGRVSSVQGGEAPARNTPGEKPGSLSGIVVDSSGARIPNADVRLVSRNNAFQKSVQTDATGNFSFEDVPAAHYTLEVSSKGMGGTFRSFEFKAEGEPPFFPFVLHPGSVAETVAVTAKAPDNPGDKAAKLGPRRIRVGGAVEAAKLIKSPPPEYPEAAKDRGAQGVVVLEATIASDGSVEDLKVVSSPDDDLTKASLDAVTKWRYQPTLLNGNPVEVVTTISVNFTLQD